MRRPERIKIVIKHMKNGLLGRFLFDIGCFLSEMEAHSYANTVNLTNLAKQWKESPDLRLTQALIAFAKLPNCPGFWFYKEETDWLIEQRVVKARDITFWGSNYNKKGVLLENTKWSLVRDLGTEHIENIFKWFDKPEHLGIGRFKKSAMGKILSEELNQRENAAV